MTDELEEYRKKIRRQEEQLRVHIARIGIQQDFSQPIEAPAPDEPLAEFFIYLDLLRENLQDLFEENQELVNSLEQRVQERTAELEEKMRIISAQQQTIIELSTPVLQVSDSALVMPLVGIVDTARAQQMLDNLLQAIVATQATLVILDITGVPVIDTAVAEHFTNMIRAARLLGAKLILTGVSPASAQTLVELGVDLTVVSTKGTLRDALEQAL